MKITVIGTGYVGLVTGTCFAELGNEIICVDIDKQKVSQLIKGIIPIYEPGLEELVQKNLKEKRLNFTTIAEKAVKISKVIFIAVGTPPDKSGQADLRYVKQATRDIAKFINEYKIVVNKSTVPVGTGDIVKQIIQKKYKGKFSVVSNPEFLREGSAVYECLHPDRVVIGNEDEKSKKIMMQLYEPLRCPMVFTDIKSAELIKYASNAMLATQISFINSIARICDKVGANVESVAEGMKLDKRIGKYAFLNAGGGYGGSCFPKDVRALIKSSEKNGFNFSILKAVEEINEGQKKLVVKKVKQLIKNLMGKVIAVWGLAFKPQTNDIRDATSITVIKELLKEKAKIKVFDPVAEKETRQIFPQLHYCSSLWESVKGADGLIILTEWDEFKELDKQKLKNILKKPNVVDARNIFDPDEMEALGFNYLSIGR